MRNFLLIVFLFSAAACAPRPFGLSHAPENAPPGFKLGYEDGCETGLASFGNSYYKTFYKFKKNMELRNDPFYSNGWTKGYNYCRQYSMRWAFDAMDR